MTEMADWAPLIKDQQTEAASKLARIVALLHERALDAILISRHENIAWTTGGMVDVRVPMLRETGVGSLLITKQGETYYVTTNNEVARLAEEEFSHLNYKPLVQPWYANDVEASVRKVVSEGKIATDVPMPFGCMISMQSLRMELTESEVFRYRWLGRQTADAACALLRNLRPGMTEMTIQGMLAESLFSRAILPSVYLTATDHRIVSYRHAVPRRGVLDRFGMLNFCARRWGLSVSITRFVHFGAVPSELERKFQAVAEVNAKLLHATREGACSDALFTVAEEAYASAGYPGEERMHHQGGATGYLEREWVARPGGAELVGTQQAFAWNPNLQGAKVEDTVVLQNGHIELLTETSDLPSITTKVDETEYRSATLLRG